MKNLKKLFDECIKEMDAIGIEYGKISQVAVNTRAKRRWGICLKQPDGTFKIEISDRLLSDDVSDDACKNTIVHEILHTCKGCLNHGNAWKIKAAKVNSKYKQYNIKRTTSNDEKGIDEKVVEKDYPYQFKCTGCCKIVKRMKQSKFVLCYDRYRCGICGGKFEKLK